MRQKDLAGELGLTAQQLAELLARRSKPTGAQALRILDFLTTKTIMTPTDETPIDAHNGRPNSLLEAREMLDLLRQELKLQAGRTGNLPRVAEPNLPKPKGPLLGGDPKPFDPEKVDPSFKKMEDTKPVPLKRLPESANTPVAIQKILDLTVLEDLVSMLDNPEHSPLQRGMIYTEIKRRRSLTGNR